MTIQQKIDIIEMNKLSESSIPPRQIANFKDLVRLYESKQFKKGLKLADRMLEAMPDNPETLCMKGLLLCLTESSQDGLALAKGALLKNLKSEICWHVLGIIHRNAKNYPEAIKCYNMALKFDKGNLQILRDLALLQMQTRDYKGHYKTRQALLQDKPQLPINWVGFALANHFVKDYAQTSQVLDSLWKILDNDQEVKAQEKNEVVSYQASMLRESKDWQALLQLLKDRKSLFLDQLYYHQCLLEGHSQLGHTDSALSALAVLRRLAPDDNQYVLQEVALKQLKDQSLLEFYQAQIQEQPTNHFLRLEQLRHFQEQTPFKSALQNFIKPFYVKGIPSLFGKLKCLYPARAEWIEESLKEILTSLQTNNTFPGEDDEQTPSAVLWAQMVLGQHYDHTRRLDLARTHLDAAITHTPTLVDLYLFRAKVEKHDGHFQEAASLVNQAMQLDLADRYLNNKAIKYLLRADQIDQAASLFKEFMKDDANAHDLQTMWYELETAESYLRQGQLGPAIRWFQFIQGHYDEIYEDQFDFYTFSLKKYNLRYFLEVMRHEDSLRGNQKYLRAAQGIIPALIALHKERLEKPAAKEDEQKLKGAEKKKAKKEKQEQPEENQDQQDKQDLMGEKLLAELKCPLEQAWKWGAHLLALDSPLAFPSDLAMALVQLWQLVIYQAASLSKQVQVIRSLLATKHYVTPVQKIFVQFLAQHNDTTDPSAKIVVTTLQAMDLPKE